MVCFISAKLILYKTLVGARKADFYEKTFNLVNNIIKEQ